MLCERCGKKEASFFYRESVNGTVKTCKLCVDCASAMQKSGELQTGVGEDPISKMMNLLSGDDFFGGDDLLGSAGLFEKLIASPAKTGERGKTCPLCGGSFQDIVKSGKAGCPRCYETFEAELLPSIRRIHGRTAHTGQAPARFREENEKKQKIAALENELKEAIKTENYERAAEIRDSLKGLRNA